MSDNSGLKATKIIGQRKAFYRQRIPEFSCATKETVDIGIFVTSRNGDRKIMQSIRIIVTKSNPGMIVTKGHTYLNKLEVLSEGLLKCVWPFVTTIPGVEGFKGVLEIFKDKIRSVQPAVLFEKAVLEIFRKFLENHL